MTRRDERCPWHFHADALRFPDGGLDGFWLGTGVTLASMNTTSCAFLLRMLPATVLACVAAAASLRAADTVGLQTLDLTLMKQGWGKPQVDRSIREKPLTIAGQVFEHGVGTHAVSLLWLDLGGGTERFQAAVGLDDAAGAAGSIEFKVIGDGQTLWRSGVMKTGQKAKAVDLDLHGLQTLLLYVGDAGDGINYDHADWADARFVVTGPKPKVIAAPNETAVRLTPKPSPAPRLNGPRVYGCRPGNPFLYRIPCTGDRPMAFQATGLPAGLQLDAGSGIITGTAPARGEYGVTLTAQNASGKDTRTFKIVAGDTLALTPPMGWNHWYTHYNRITDALMRHAADTIVASGMADVGYQYVCIDDCWMNAPSLSKYQTDPKRVGPLRDESGRIQPNQYFPDMPALTAYIHGLGLKAGIYTSPGPRTCAGFGASYQHEAQDARTFADWGFDFLKYDWCSYGGIAKKDQSLAALQKPYRLMGGLLKEQKRDIVFNLCQYGMGNVWEWGADVGGHCWRTAGDLGFELERFFDVALRNAEHRAWSKPGAWNDPDYIQIGWIGSQRGTNFTQSTPCPLTPNEQYAYFSLWCLMAAPLFYSGDMTHLDEFTLNVLCNPEVIEVDQDALGRSASVAQVNDSAFLMVKDLADGTKAVGLFNRGEFPVEVAAPWAVVGVAGKQVVRDLWRQKDLGEFAGEFKTTVPRHGVVLVRIGTK
jgi:alpha-galactosidase